MDTSVEQALNYAWCLLSYRSRSYQEIERRLTLRGYSPRVQAAVIAKLEDMGYINDLEFARQWVNDRIRFKPMGSYGLKKELIQRGISLEIAERVVAELVPVELEYDLALLIGKRRWERLQGLHVGQRCQKLANLLLYRGFSPAIIVAVTAEVAAAPGSV